MLLYVLDSRGSSPGRKGFFMAVNGEHEMEGSIGGGMMEHKLVEMAKEKLSTASAGRQDYSIKKQVHDKSAGKDQSGMICSGEQVIYIYPVKPEDKSTIVKIIASLGKFRNAVLTITPGGITFSEQTPTEDFHFQMKNEHDWLYREKIGYKNQLSIIGAGHCSLALSRLMREMDFYIRLYDDRAGLKTMEQNSFAHEKHLLENYGQLTEKLPELENHYVVIMTFGYRTDDKVVRALVNRPFTYLGLLGSSKKIGTMMDEYGRDGLPASWLKTIHSPIGIQIKSQTPEEIAVSIAAEIIKVKNSQRP